MLSLLTGLMVLVTAAGEPEKAGPETPGEQYAGLLKKYDASPWVYIRDRQKAKAASAPFLKLAREYPNDPVSFDALRWVVTHTFSLDESGQAMELLARDHSTSERLGPLCRELDIFYGGTFKPLDYLFRAAIRNNPNREVRASACLALARRLKKDKEIIECARLQSEAESKGRRVPFVERPSQTDEDLARMDEEAASLFERVIEQFGDIKDDTGTLGETARFERALSVGRVAPEIEGVDADGRPFKLSDFRGKLVVLLFWNHENCGPCRAAYPAERELVKRMEGKPVVYLGVNSGDSLETLKKLRETGEVTWRFWVDGDRSEGKIFKTWGVRGVPSIFVVDGKGFIRHQGIGMSHLPLMEFAVEKLLADQGTASK